MAHNVIFLHDIANGFNFEDNGNIFGGNADLGFVDSDANDFSIAAIDNLEEQPPRWDSVFLAMNCLRMLSLPPLLWTFQMKI